MSDDYMFGLAIGNGQRANAATAAAYQGAQELHKAAAYIGKLKDENATMKRQAQIDDASIAGLKAQIDAFKAQHPTSPLLANSGKLFNDGGAKSKLRLIYELAFDAALRAVGIVSTGSIRKD